MATALDIIKSALRKINSYQSGETIATPDENDCLEALNDLLDSWSTDQLMVYGSNEYVLHWQSGRRQYTVGNPTSAELGLPPIQGTLVGGTNTIAVASYPTNLVVGATLTDQANVIPADTVVTLLAPGVITMSNNATATPSIGLDPITYTLPGDFAVARPLRITGGYTRFSNLDFLFDVYTTQEQYNAILYKAQPGPWPTVAWYNPAFPYGFLNVYQVPGSNAEVHLFTDTILSRLTLNQTFVLPQGYALALKWGLAQQLCAEYGFPESPIIKKQAYESLARVKALNAQPADRATYDRALLRGNRADGGWIFHGGYY
jgi:hypothetical protein